MGTENEITDRTMGKSDNLKVTLRKKEEEYGYLLVYKKSSFSFSR